MTLKSTIHQLATDECLSVQAQAATLEALLLILKTGTSIIIYACMLNLGAVIEYIRPYTYAIKLY